MLSSTSVFRHAHVEPWPTPPQTLLLQAALLRGAPAVQAWRRWRSQVRFEDIDGESYWALPLTSANLTAQGLDDPLIGRLKGIYRRTWYQNQLRFHALSGPLQRLADAGIPTMLLKGAALVTHYYQDHGLRPMSDVDVCVPADRAAEALDVLDRAGLIRGAPETQPEQHFADDAGHELDLHWNPLPDSPAADAGADLWHGAIETSFGGVPTRVLRPAEQLLHVCVHGMVHAPIGGEFSRVRWVMDAVMVLRTSAASLDWDRLLAASRGARLVPPIRDALAYLSRTFEAPVPAPALKMFRTARVPLLDEAVHRARSRPSERCWPWFSLCLCYAEHARDMPPGSGALRTLAGLPGYYRRRWGAERAWQLPAIAAAKTARRAWSAARARWADRWAPPAEAAERARRLTQ